MRGGVKLCNVAIKFAVAEAHRVVVGNYAVVAVYGVDLFHKVNAVGFNPKPYNAADDKDAGGAQGNIISMIYKGDHYRYIVRRER